VDTVEQRKKRQTRGGRHNRAKKAGNGTPGDGGVAKQQ
jgi:hypothetical protein